MYAAAYLWEKQLYSLLICAFLKFFSYNLKLENTLRAAILFPSVVGQLKYLIRSLQWPYCVYCPAEEFAQDYVSRMLQSWV